jgi:hypothetical protein
MPHPSTVRDWMAANAEVSRAIACAREDGHDAISVNARDVARGRGESTGDWQRDKLIIDTDLKLLAKWDPKRYGERQQIDLDAKLEVQQADPTSIANQLVTLGTQYPTLNPVIRDLAQSILDRLPALPG